MSRVRQLTASIGSTLVSQVLGILVSLVFIAYFGRLLSKSEMALYAFLFTLQSWVTLISGMGLATLAVRDTPGLAAGGQMPQARRLLSSALVYRTLVGVMVTVVLILLAPRLGRQLFGSDDFASEMALVSVGGLVLSVLSTASLLQWALQRFQWRATCDLLGNVATRVLAVAGFLIWGFQGFLAGTILGGMVAVGLQLYTLRDVLCLDLLPPGPLLRRSGPYMGSDILRNLLMNLDQPLVGFLLGDAALADFFVAKRCYAFFAAAAMAVTGPLGARISEARIQGEAALKEYFQKALYVVAILFVPAGLALIALSEPLLQVLVGSKYVSAASILSLYGVVLAVSATYELWYEGVVRLLTGYHAMLQNLIVSLLMYGAYFVFLPLAGPAGIPLSATVAWLGAMVLAAWSIRRRVGLTCRPGLYVRPVLCGLLVMAVVLPGLWLPETTGFFVITILAGGAAYALGFWLFAPPEVVSLVRRLKNRLGALRGDVAEAGGAC